MKKILISFLLTTSIILRLNAEFHKLLINGNEYALNWETNLKYFYSGQDKTQGNINILIFSNGKEIGYIHLFLYSESNQTEAYLAEIEIFPEQRGKGIGKAIIKHVCKEVLKIVDQIWLYVSPFNIKNDQEYETMINKTINLYKKCGFICPDKTHPRQLIYKKNTEIKSKL